MIGMYGPCLVAIALDNFVFHQMVEISFSGDFEADPIGDFRCHNVTLRGGVAPAAHALKQCRNKSRVVLRQRLCEKLFGLRVTLQTVANGIDYGVFTLR